MDRPSGSRGERAQVSPALRCRRRCTGPRSGVGAGRSGASILDPDPADDEAIRDRVLDGEADDFAEDDAEPAGAIEDPRLQSLIDQALSLARATKLSRDPKLKLLTEEIVALVADGFAPVVFCRYIATAKAVAERLGALPAIKDVAVEVVTGELPSQDREARVAELAAQDKRVLVATDCLSEGINLQNSFDAVVHYDLSWNPTRHQQREGRVDRFGQPSRKVRSLLLYGENNPVDGAVLNVILRKAEAIRRDTGVPVPLPDDERRMTEALMQAVLLRRRETRQLSLDFSDTPATGRCSTYRWKYHALRSRSEGVPTTMRASRGDRCRTIRLIVPSLPAASRPSTITRTFCPVSMTWRCSFTNSTCAAFKSAFSLFFSPPYGGGAGFRTCESLVGRPSHCVGGRPEPPNQWRDHRCGAPSAEHRTNQNSRAALFHMASS
jgi:Helicase conserved C-terminal domain